MSGNAKGGVDLRRGARMAGLDNVLRAVEPLLVLSCASVYAGGEWGSFKLAESLAYLLFRASLLGLDRGIVWWFGQVDEGRYRRDLFASLLAALVASLVAGGATLGISLAAIGEVKGLALPTGQVLLIAGAVPLLALSEILYQANLNRGSMLARILGKDLVLPVVTFGGALASHRFHGPGLPAWFLTGCAANACVALGSFLFLHSLAWADACPGLPSRKLLSFSLPLTGSDLLTGLTSRIDIMLIGALADIRAVEVYNVVTMVGRSLQAIRESFDGFLFSSFSREGARELTPTLRERLNFATWNVGNVLCLAFLVLVFWGRDLLSLLDKEYAGSFLPLLVMAGFSCLNIFGDMGGLMLQGLGRSRLWMAALAVGFLVNVGLNVWWVPLLGPLGGVLALKVSQFAQGAASQLFLAKVGRSRIWISEYLLNQLGFVAILAGVSAFFLLMETPLRIKLPFFAILATSWIAILRGYSIGFSCRPGVVPDRVPPATAWHE